MRGLLIIALCAVYSVQAWYDKLSNLHVRTSTGSLPPPYLPLTDDDKHATRKAGALVSFIKNVPQANPLQLPSLGPYHVSLPDVDFEGDILLKNVVVQGLKGVSVSGLEVRMAPSRIDFNVSVPQVTADFGFEVQAVLANQPINVNGQISATLLNLAAAAEVGPKVAQILPNPVYQVDAAHVVIDLGELQVQMTMSDYAEEFRNIGLQFLQNMDQYASIVQDLLRAVLKGINKELAQITAKDILQYLLGSARPSLNIG